ncbi:hypothetical protein P7C71_g5526, partial [Lecanoromycetidae sp. Uapishka_2]
MTSILPPIPRFVFTIFEPIALAAGFLCPMVDTPAFIQSQLPSTSSASASNVTISDSARIVALQLGNVYGLLAMIGVGILYTTTEPKVVRNFLLACAVADVGHLYVTYIVMGQEDFLDFQGWNQMAWGNIGITAGLLLVRVLYLTGALGQDRNVKSTRDAVKKNI